MRVLLLQGAGERAFCTGNDTSEFDVIRADAAQSAAYNELQRAVAHRMAALTKPAVAAIHGHCLGAGWNSPSMRPALRFRRCAHGRPRRAARPALPAGGHCQAGGRGRPRHRAGVGADRGQRDGRGTGTPRPRHAAAARPAACARRRPRRRRRSRRRRRYPCAPPRPPSSSCRAATRRRTCSARSASPTPATTAPTTPRAGRRAATAGRRASGESDAVRRRPLLAAAATLLASPVLAQPRGPIRVLVGFAPAAPWTSRCGSRRTPWRGAAGPPWSPRRAPARSASWPPRRFRAGAGRADAGHRDHGHDERGPPARLADPAGPRPRADAGLQPHRHADGAHRARGLAGPRRRGAGGARPRQPRMLTYASTGNGSTNQLAAEHFAAEAGGLRLVHVAYRGGALRPRWTWPPAAST